MPKTTKPANLPQAQLKRFKMNLVHMKSLQAQIKIKTKKSLSNHPRHNYSQICSCPTLKVPRWIGQWMMVYTIDSLNGSCSVRTFWSVGMPCYQKRGNARKVIAWSGDFGIGPVCFLECVHRRINARYHLRKNLKSFASPNQMKTGLDLTC